MMIESKNMGFVRIRITSLARAGMAVAVCLALGCGASASEVRTANTAGYDADFPLIYGETLEAVRTLYPNLQESSTEGVIKTAWHPVRLASDDTGTAANQSRGLGTTSTAATTVMPKRYFVRFDVHVVGGKPWRVRVYGQASAWEVGAAVPSELRGGDEPPWLKGRVESLQVAIYRRLQTYAVASKDGDDGGDDGPARARAGTSEAAAAADLSRFGNIPQAAAQAAAEVERAVESRDFAALRAVMAEEFTWSLGAAPSAREALILWQADSRMLDELRAVLAAGCRSAADRQQVTCPPAYTEQPGYRGYRAGFAPDPSNPANGGAWKMVFFVSGD